MLIVEGMDNAGKTTLAKKLQEKFDLKEIVKSPGPVSYRKLFIFADKWLSLMEKLVLKTEKINKYPFLHDRFPAFSDQVYGPVLRGINPFNELDEGKWLMGRLMNVRPAVIYCRPVTETIIKFDEDQEQMEGVKDHALVLLGRWDELMLHWERRTGSPLIRYDYERHSDEELFEMLERKGWV